MDKTRVYLEQKKDFREGRERKRREERKEFVWARGSSVQRDHVRANHMCEKA